MMLSSLWLEMDAGVPISAPSSSPESGANFAIFASPVLVGLPS